MQRRWEVDFGPQFAESVQSCDMAPTRLQLHIDAFKLDLERDPFMCSEPFGVDARRVLQTTDFAEGARGEPRAMKQPYLAGALCARDGALVKLRGGVPTFRGRRGRACRAGVVGHPRRPRARCER